MSFSSIREMLQACQESRQPLYEVILESDLAESGLTRAESEAEMHRLWSVMRATSDGYCGADRSMSGFVGGDAAKVEQAPSRRKELYGGDYLAAVTGRSSQDRRVQRLHEAHRRCPHGGQLRRPARCSAAALARSGEADEEVRLPTPSMSPPGSVRSSRPAPLSAGRGGRLPGRGGRRQRHGRRSPLST